MLSSPKSSTAKRQQIFERREIAEILEMPYAQVQNWSIGKPLSIRPSLREPGRKGSPNLYTIEDLYLMAVAVSLQQQQGLSVPMIGEVVELLGKHAEWSSWADEQTRGVLVISRSDSGAVKLKHFGPSGSSQGNPALVRYALAQKNLIWLNLEQVLGNVDATVKKLRKS